MPPKEEEAEVHKSYRRVPRTAYRGLTRGALLLMLTSWLGGCDANQVTSAITCSSGLYGSEVSWSLSCSDGTTLSAARPNGAPYTSSVPLAVALGATCTLIMEDQWSDGWNGAEWAAPGFGQSFSLDSGPKTDTRSFVVQFQPPPSPPRAPTPSRSRGG